MTEAPLFSIIIPTYNRSAQLAGCLGALARLEYPRRRFQVIVVDDGSRNPPATTVAALRDRLDVTLISQPNTGPAAARNAGAARAWGEFLAFTDDDCAPAPGWLAALAAGFAAAPDCAIGGRTINALPTSPHATASQLLVDYLHAYYNADPGQAHFFTANNLAMPAGRFRTIGGFDTTYTRTAAEDREICDHWLHQGYRVVYAPEAVVYHAQTLDFRRFCRQHYTYGRGAHRFHRARGRRGVGRPRLEPPTFYLNLLRYPFLIGMGRRASLLSILLWLSQAAHTVGHLWERVVATQEPVTSG